mgnify:FL=1
MASHDPLGDMLAMLKNANTRGLQKVQLHHSNMKEHVAQVLKKEGYLADVRVDEVEGKRGSRKYLHIAMKYDADRGKALTDLKRVSKPGRRIFRGADNLGKVQDGLGISVISTSHGIVSDREAKSKNIGGEILCKVW